MASVWITARQTSARKKRYRVIWRLGGRESTPRYGGSFSTHREALARKAWIAGELASMRVPDVHALEHAPEPAPALAEVSRRWQASRVDVRDSTTVQHRTALGRVLPVVGSRRVDDIAASDVAALVGQLAADGYARESIRKSVTALAMVLDFAGISPNPARDRAHVRLPLAEPEEPEPPMAEHVETVARVLTPSYRLALLVLDTTGCRIGELEVARVGDLDEQRKAWLVRAAVAKTRRARWVGLPDDLWDALIERLPPREDRRAEIASSPTSPPTGFAWRSAAPARPQASRTSTRTPFVTGASRCSTSAASPGRRSAIW
jgi:hypothetical protein